jgi:hypothetical protein
MKPKRKRIVMNKVPRLIQEVLSLAKAFQNLQGVPKSRKRATTPIAIKIKDRMIPTSEWKIREKRKRAAPVPEKKKSRAMPNPQPVWTL